MNAITRTLSPSHGLFYSFDSRNKKSISQKTPVSLQEVSLVGTLGSWKEGEAAQKEQEKGKEQKVASNIQTVDTCFLPAEHDAYCLTFNLRIASLVDDVISNDKAVLALFRQFVTDYKEKVGGELLAQRYLTNLINGRFLWRNKYAHQKQITLRIDDDSHTFSIDLAFDFTSRFTDTKDQIAFDAFVTKMAQALFSKEHVTLLYVSATGIIGYGQEIYPSQEFVNDSKEKKSKVLFSVLSNQHPVAAFHSQKIGNAIRTIDTWYENNVTHAIPVDPFGPDKSNQTLHRAGVNTNDKSIYSVFNRLLDAKKGIDIPSDDAHYLMACFIRGGVYAGK